VSCPSLARHSTLYIITNGLIDQPRTEGRIALLLYLDTITSLISSIVPKLNSDCRFVLEQLSPAEKMGLAGIMSKRTRETSVALETGDSRCDSGGSNAQRGPMGEKG